MVSLLNNIGLGTKKGLLMEFFLKHPRKQIHLRHLSRVLSISHPWVARSCRDLQQHNLLIVNKLKERKELSIQAHHDHPAYLALKQSYNFYSLFASRLVEYLIKTYGRPECIVVFGSYAKGEDIETSDIDIAVLTSRKKRLDLKSYSKILERPIVVKELSKQNIKKEFWNTLANGIVLYGYLEVKK